MEDYCTFEQSVALKELGFDWETETFWNDEGSPEEHQWVIAYTLLHHFVSNDEDCTVLRPTLAQAAKWLREVKGIYVDVFLNASGYGWELNKTKPIYETNGTRLQQYDFKGEHEDSGMWLTYEQALSAGIDQALELLTDKSEDK